MEFVFALVLRQCGWWLVGKNVQIGMYLSEKKIYGSYTVHNLKYRKMYTKEIWFYCYRVTRAKLACHVLCLCIKEVLYNTSMVLIFKMKFAAAARDDEILRMKILLARRSVGCRLRAWMKYILSSAKSFLWRVYLYLPAVKGKTEKDRYVYKR